jgi:hypothetical protein
LIGSLSFGTKLVYQLQQKHGRCAPRRKLLKAYLLKESLDRWSCRTRDRCCAIYQQWIDQLRWQRLKPFQKLAWMLLDHLEGISNYCRTKVPLGVVEAVNGNIKALMRRKRGMCVRFSLRALNSILQPCHREKHDHCRD